ncbi:CLN3_protein [Hexamita inflata]|uniref:CLN3 protein n=1 Tax=Hexamita inflata TaxID=28002 RepID=A0AA86NDS5_9EUKA|nr:CLN3 protein [Hexamita inflata]
MIKQKRKDETSETEPFRNVLSFIISGWSNNFGFYVMLSAAKHMMQNKVATSAVLICDTLPCFIIQLILPFFLDKIPYAVQVSFIVLFALLGFILAILAEDRIYLALIAVSFHSLSLGLGETTFFAYSTKFSTKCVSAFSSGTGLAGITAAGIYAILADVFHVPFKVILYIFLPVPIFMLLAFSISKPSQLKQSNNNILQNQNVDLLVSDAIPDQMPVKVEKLSFAQKLNSLKSISMFILSLFIVYTSQYSINQSVDSVIDFPPPYTSKHYTFSQFAFRFGIFLARSSLPLFKFPYKFISIPSIFQVLNLILFCFQAQFLFIKWFWAVQFLSFVEGLLGGLVYVTAMYWTSVQSSGVEKEFKMGIICVFNNFGIVVASCLGFWLQPYLKEHKKW